MRSPLRVWQEGKKALSAVHSTSGPFGPIVWTGPQMESAAAYAHVGDGADNSAVTAVLGAKARGFTEPTPAVFRREGQLWMPVYHELDELLFNPNPDMTWGLVADFWVHCIDLDGDAYGWIIRNQLGDAVEVWPLHPSLVTAKGNSQELITHYTYIVDGVSFEIRKQDMVHIRQGISRDNPRKGRAVIRAVLLEVMTDEEASKFVGWLLKNLGIPGVILSPVVGEYEEGPSPTEADEVQEKFVERFTGRGRGKPLVMSGGQWRVDQVSFSPQQLDIKSLRRLPEERIGAVAGVPLALANLGAGLESGSSLGGNVRDSDQSWMTENTLIPAWREWGRQLTKQVLWPTMDMPSTEFQIRFPLDEIRALQKDREATLKTLSAGVEAGWVKVSEPRQTMGLEVDDARDGVYLRGLNVEAVRGDEETGIQDDEG